MANNMNSIVQQAISAIKNSDGGMTLEQSQLLNDKLMLCNLQVMAQNDNIFWLVMHTESCIEKLQILMLIAFEAGKLTRADALVEQKEYYG